MDWFLYYRDLRHERVKIDIRSAIIESSIVMANLNITRNHNGLESTFPVSITA